MSLHRRVLACTFHLWAVRFSFVPLLASPGTLLQDDEGVLCSKLLRHLLFFFPRLRPMAIDASTAAVLIPAVKIQIAVALKSSPHSQQNGHLPAEDGVAPANFELAWSLCVQCFDAAQHQLAQSIFKNLQETFIIHRQQIAACSLHSAMV